MTRFVVIYAHVGRNRVPLADVSVCTDMQNKMAMAENAEAHIPATLALLQV